MLPPPPPHTHILCFYYHCFEVGAPSLSLAHHPPDHVPPVCAGVPGNQLLTKARRPRQSDTLALKGDGHSSSAFDAGAQTVRLLLLYAALHRASGVPHGPLCLVVYNMRCMSANTHLCLPKERGWRWGGDQAGKHTAGKAAFTLLSCSFVRVESL